LSHSLFRTVSEGRSAVYSEQKNSLTNSSDESLLDNAWFRSAYIAPGSQQYASKLIKHGSLQNLDKNR